MDEMGLGLIAVKLVVGFTSLYLILILTGRTSISQLTPFHFVFVLLLDDFLGHIVYENHVSIWKYFYVIGLWTLLMLGLEFLTMKYTKIRYILQGKPTIIIRNGRIDRKATKKFKLDVNQILSLLRQQSVFSVREVEIAILEPNGQISVVLKSKYKKPTIEDFHLPEKKVHLPVTLIIDGKILFDNLFECGFDKEWLENELNGHGYKDIHTIFYAEWKEPEGLHISPK